MALNQQIPVAINISIGFSGQANATQAAEAVKKVGGAAKSAARDFASLAGAYTALLTVKYVASAMRAVIAPAIEMQSAMVKLGAYTRATKTELEGYRKTALDVAAKTPFGPKEAADAMLQLYRATGSAAKAQEYLESTAGMAAASMGAMNLSETSKMTGELHKGFQNTASGAFDVKNALDKMAAGALAAGVPVENYSKIVGRLGVAAKAGGQGFDEIMQAFLLMNRSIRSPEMATSALLRIAEELTTSKTQQALRGIGVEAIDSAGRIRNLSVITQEIFQRSISAPERVRNALNQAFTARSQLGLQALVGNAPMQAYLQQTMSRAGGTLAAIQEKALESPEIQFQRMRENLYGLAVVVGDKLVPPLVKVARLISAVSDFLAENDSFANLASGTLIVAGLAGSLWGAVAAAKALSRILAVAHAFAGGQSLAAATAGASGTAGAAAAGGGSNLLYGAAAWQAATGAKAAVQPAANAAGNAAWQAATGGVPTSQAAASASFLAAGPIAAAIGTVIVGRAAAEEWEKRFIKEVMEKKKIDETEAKLLLDSESLLAGEEELEKLKQYRLEKTREVERMVMDDTMKLIQMMRDAIDAGKAVASYMQLGSKEWKDSLSQFKAIIKYQPPIVNIGKYEQGVAAMGSGGERLRAMALKKGTSAGQRASMVATANAVRNAAMKYGAIRLMLETGMQGELPTGLVDYMKSMMLEQLVMAKDLEAQYPGIMGGKTNISKMEKELETVNEWGSEPNVLATRIRQRAYGAKLRATDKDPLKTTPLTETPQPYGPESVGPAALLERLKTPKVEQETALRIVGGYMAQMNKLLSNELKVRVVNVSDRLSDDVGLLGKLKFH